jgi:hypothetical protein
MVPSVVTKIRAGLPRHRGSTLGKTETYFYSPKVIHPLIRLTFEHYGLSHRMKASESDADHFH